MGYNLSVQSDPVHSSLGSSRLCSSILLLPSLKEPESHILCPGLAWPLFPVPQLTSRLFTRSRSACLWPTDLSYSTFLLHPARFCTSFSRVLPCKSNDLSFHTPFSTPRSIFKSRLVPGYTYCIPTQFPVSTRLYSTKVYLSFRLNLTCTSSVLPQFALS